MSTEAKCPVMSGALKSTAAGGRTNADWWPNQLNLKILNQNSPQIDPMGKEFNYVEALELLSVVEVLAHRIGLGRMLMKNLEVQLIGPPIRIGPGPRRCGFNGTVHYWALGFG